LNSQTYQKWIHVIVDGNSSVEHIRSISSFAQSKTIFLSEPDEGIYDAMNKGWKLVPSNFYIIFLNSGDEFAHPNSLESIANVICENDFPNFLYSNFEQVEEEIGVWYSKLVVKPNAYNQLYAYGYMSHQSTVIRGNLIKELGGFDTKLQVASDWDLLVRALRCTSPIRVNVPIARFFVGGFSSRNIEIAHDELYFLRKKYLTKKKSRIIYELLWSMTYLNFLQNKWQIKLIKRLKKLILLPFKLTLNTIRFLDPVRLLNRGYFSTVIISNIANLRLSSTFSPLKFFFRLFLHAGLYTVMYFRNVLVRYFVFPILRLRQKLAFEVEPRFRNWLHKKLGLQNYF
jgi:hypothetical protein